MRSFAIRFIYESNAIEGSKLSQDEVSAIIRKQYVKKSIPQREVQEALNSIKAFEYIQSPAFKLSQKTIKHLHKIVTHDLGVPFGFKTQKIVVNNKQTTPPEKVRKELSALLSWYKQTKKREHPFARATIFHNRFELVHPFTDGNGRVGRLFLNWMLLRDGYGVLLFRTGNRRAYMSALNKGDEGRHRNILKLSRHTYQKTIRDFVGEKE
jgi:Fic family protein